jgi:gamma-glutamylaminecyclotransferase
MQLDFFPYDQKWMSKLVPKPKKWDYVYVYATLERGYGNHRLLQGYRMWKAKAEGIDLHDGTAFPFAKRGSHVTHGELYEVPNDVLESLDHLEGHPHFYRRERTTILVGNKKVDAWIYLYQ